MNECPQCRDGYPIIKVGDKGYHEAFGITRECTRPPITRIHDEITLHEGASAHAEYVFWHGMPAVYEYNRAENGPECEVITRILAHHPLYIPREEKRRLDKAAREVRTF